METYEQIVARYQGRTNGPGSLSPYAGTTGQAPPANDYESVVKRHGGRPIRFDGTDPDFPLGGRNGQTTGGIGTPGGGLGIPGPSVGGIQPIDGGQAPSLGAPAAGRTGPPKPPSLDIIANLQRQADETAAQLMFATGDPRARGSNPLYQKLQDLNETIAIVSGKARASGERESLLDRAGPNMARQLVGLAQGAKYLRPEMLLLDALTGAGKDQQVLEDQLVADVAALPPSAGMAEKLTDIGAAAAPHVGVGLATAPAQVAGTAAATARGAAPWLAKLAGAGVQEAALAPGTIASSDSWGQALFSILAGTGGGAVLGGGAKGAADDVMSKGVTPAAKEVAPEVAPQAAKEVVPEVAAPAAKALAAAEPPIEPGFRRLYKGTGDELQGEYTPGTTAGNAREGVSFSDNRRLAETFAQRYSNPKITYLDVPEENVGQWSHPQKKGEFVVPGPAAARAQDLAVVQPRQYELQAEPEPARMAAPGSPPAPRPALARPQQAPDASSPPPTPPGGQSAPARATPDVAGGGLPYKPIPRDADGEVDLPKYINENLNTERIQADDGTLQEMYNTGRVHGLEVKVAKGAPRSFAVVEAEANQILKSSRAVKKLLDHPSDYVYTDAEGFALRQVYVAKNKLAADVGERYLKGGADLEDEFLASLDGVREMEMKRASGAAASGRSLSAMRMVAEGKGISKDALEKIGKYLAASGKDPNKIAAFIKELDPSELKKPGFFDKLHHWWINSLVSGSHPVNLASGVGQYLTQGAKRTVAAGIDVPLSLLRGGKREVYLNEAAELVKFKGLGEGLQHGWNFFKTGVSQGPANVSKLGRQEVTGIAGSVKFLGSRPLGAVDEVVSMVAYTGEARALAYREAMSEGLRGQAVQARAAVLMANLPERIRVKAVAAAKRVTYTDDTWLGNIAGRIAQAEVDVLGKTFKPMRWILPFTRVSSSMLTQGLEMTPAGFASVAAQRAAGKETGRTLAEDLSAPTIGTMLGLTAWWMKSSGMLTGGSRPDTSERGTMEAEGWQPDSIKVGNTYVSVSKLGPPAQAMLMFSHAVDALGSGKDKEGMSYLSDGVKLLQGLSRDSWMQGIADLVDTFQDETGAKVEKFAGKTAAGFVPNVLRRGLKETTGTTDVKTTGFLDTLGKEVGLAGAGTKKQDPFGREQGRDRTYLESASRFMGIPVSKARNDPVLLERMRLGVAIMPVDTPGSKEDELSFRKDEALIKDPQALSAFRKTKGEAFYRLDRALISDPRYRKASDDGKATMLKRSRSQAATAFHASWRKAGRPIGQAGLAKVRINDRQILNSAMSIRKLQLEPADLERFDEITRGAR